MDLNQIFESMGVDVEKFCEMVSKSLIEKPKTDREELLADCKDLINRIEKTGFTNEMEEWHQSLQTPPPASEVDVCDVLERVIKLLGEIGPSSTNTPQ